jgi:hypothetical protein
MSLFDTNDGSGQEGLESTDPMLEEIMLKFGGKQAEQTERFQQQQLAILKSIVENQQGGAARGGGGVAGTTPGGGAAGTTPTLRGNLNQK